MTRHSVQPRDEIFVKGSGFLFYAKTMGKNIGKSISKSFSGKYCQTILDHAKQSAKDAIKTSSKRVIQKAAKATGDLIGSEMTNKITKVSKNVQQNNFEIVANENDKEIPKEIYMFPEKTEIIDNIRLK